MIRTFVGDGEHWNQTISRRRSTGVLTIIGVAAILTSSSGVAAAESTVQPSLSIKVVARATVTVAPDQARVTLGVTTDRKTATAAATENARKMEQVLAVLKKEVGADGEIQTAEVTVRPRFAESHRQWPTPRILGYTAINTVNIQMANFRAIGRLLDAVFQAGANTVEDVQFTLKDWEPAQNQALREASARARRRASALAEGQGLRVGEVISASDDDREVLFYRGGKVGGGSRNANIVATPLEPGLVEVSAAVTVTFALKPLPAAPGVNRP